MGPRTALASSWLQAQEVLPAHRKQPSSARLAGHGGGPRAVPQQARLSCSSCGEAGHAAYGQGPGESRSLSRTQNCGPKRSTSQEHRQELRRPQEGQDSSSRVALMCALPGTGPGLHCGLLDSLLLTSRTSLQVRERTSSPLGRTARACLLCVPTAWCTAAPTMRM